MLGRAVSRRVLHKKTTSTSVMNTPATSKTERIRFQRLRSGSKNTGLLLSGGFTGRKVNRMACRVRGQSGVLRSETRKSPLLDEVILTPCSLWSAEGTQFFFSALSPAWHC